MINGAHVIVYSTSPAADRAFFRDVLGLPHVDAGDGWLIFGLPPAEVAVHPAEENDIHELYLMCEDIEAFVAAAGRRKVRCQPVQDRGWGLVTQVRLPGGGKLGVYQPRHARPGAPAGAARTRGRARARAGSGPRSRTAKAAGRAKPARVSRVTSGKR